MGIRVLIVDDEPGIAAAHAEYIRRIPGFNVLTTAGNGADALDAARRASSGPAPVDLALVDVGLPDMSGLDVAGALADVTPRPDVIVVTSARDIDTVRTAVARGALLYLIKPFTFAAFSAKLERYREYRRTLGDHDVGQREIDAALAALREPAAVPATPKGIAAPTLELISSTLRDSRAPLSANEIASRTGMSRVTAWRYLERLADDRICERVPAYGGRGRPEIRYRWL
ncbi:response regulator [Tsukamurella sp. 8F]|uniref:response regulator n=1 Tax=unclassified Tsukamurella TaxID=2633480 RepID=UPI0023B93624|nr:MULTISPECIES: response regulator [unclassified Tsukamurella]MDF0528403.1 response regulator [Tsukamurella sp. 8J]MDF0586228.1 response regulator [Tsukamurella sp. 8F]